MTQTLASLELYYLTQELKEVLEGATLEKVYEGPLEDFLFVFHKSGKGKIMLKVILPGLIFLTTVKEEFSTLRKFAAWLRKNLERARVKRIEQYKFERILEFEFETKDKEEMKIIFELFSKGNIIVVDSINIIQNAFRFEEWSHRSIKKGLAYMYPPSITNTKELTLEEFSQILNNKEKEIVKILAKDLGLGKKYANYVLNTLSLDPKVLGKDLGKDQVDKIFNEINNLFSKERGAFICNNEIWPFKIENSNECKEYESLSKTIEELYGKDIVEYKFSKEINKERISLEKSLERQKKLLEEAERLEKELKEAGEKLYLNYELVTKILERVRSLTSKGLKRDEILEILNKEFSGKILDLNLKEKTIILDL